MSPNDTEVRSRMGEIFQAKTGSAAKCRRDHMSAGATATPQEFLAWWSKKGRHLGLSRRSKT
jgi:hypothetical protein